jgi:hypothetical protein
MYFGMLTLSLSFLASELGVVSLMQASFFGISGYFIAILQTRYQIPFPIAPLDRHRNVAVLFASLCRTIGNSCAGHLLSDADPGSGPIGLGAGQPMGIGDQGGLGHHRHLRSDAIFGHLHRKIEMGRSISVRAGLFFRCDLAF